MNPVAYLRQDWWVPLGFGVGGLNLQDLYDNTAWCMMRGWTFEADDPVHDEMGTFNPNNAGGFPWRGGTFSTFDYNSNSTASACVRIPGHTMNVSQNFPNDDGSGHTTVVTGLHDNEALCGLNAFYSFPLAASSYAVVQPVSGVYEFITQGVDIGRAFATCVYYNTL
jgi:hypothetical protein